MAFSLPRYDHVITLPFSPSASNRERGLFQKAVIRKLRDNYARPVQALLRAQAPRRNRQDRTTGLLRRNIRVTIASLLGYKIRIRYNVNTSKVPYAGFVVRGWDNLSGFVYDLFLSTFLNNTYRIQAAQQQAALEVHSAINRQQSIVSRQAIADASTEQAAEAARLERELAFRKQQREYEQRLKMVQQESARRLAIINRRVTARV